MYTCMNEMWITFANKTQSSPAEQLVRDIYIYIYIEILDRDIYFSKY